MSRMYLIWSMSYLQTWRRPPGAIEVIWLHFWGAVILSSFFYSPNRKKTVREPKVHLVHKLLALLCIFSDSCSASEGSLMISQHAIGQVWENKQLFVFETKKKCSKMQFEWKKNSEVEFHVPKFKYLHFYTSQICCYLVPTM